MFSESTRGYLASLAYRADAKRCVCWIPLSGIYWDDEMPDMRQLMRIPQKDQMQMYRLFGIRVRLWRGEVLSDDDRQLWDDAQSSVPRWALFTRQQVSPDDLEAQEIVCRQTTEGLEAWFALADEAKVTEKDGLQHFDLTFDLTKKFPKKKSLWQRIFGRG